MRSFHEIAFRLKQEAANLGLWLHAPAFGSAVAPGIPPPAPPEVPLDRLRELSEQILAHRFPLLGVEIETGPEIRWRRDYLSGRETGLAYFRFIPYLDAERAGDHKFIWELNRHQHLVVLAQVFALTGDRRFLDEIVAQLESWLAANPFQRGINWTSALEVAFRALSWIWIAQLAGTWFEPSFARRFSTALYRHGLHLETNLSIYFSPNTHLLGEAVALHALGRLFPQFPRAAQWTAMGARIVAQEFGRQVREDGSHFEQSSYYHLYALDMFLLHFRLAGADLKPLTKMAEYLAYLMGPMESLPFLGDDDGGRLYFPFGPRDQFGRATLASFPPVPATGSRRFTQAGVAVLQSEDVHIVFDAGPFGPGSAGHSHSDTLSFVLRRGSREEPREILIDPGTFTYMGPERHEFRGSAAHNTVLIDGLDQAEPAGAFGWRNPPLVEVVDWSSTADADVIEAECRYAGFRHRRRLEFRKPGLLRILDRIDGPAGQHLVEQFWHAGTQVTLLSPRQARVGSAVLDVGAGAQLTLSDGWRSPAFGLRIPSPVLRVARRLALPASLETEIRLDPR